MSTIRQQIVDAVKARFQQVLTANGYQTDAGRNVHVWRVIPFENAELPALNLRDTEEEIQPQSAGIHHHKLTMEVDGLAVSGSTTADALRKLLADVVQAIGVDRFWTVSGTRLAYNSEPLSSELAVEHEGQVVGGIRYRFAVHFRTKSFDEFTQ